MIKTVGLAVIVTAVVTGLVWLPGAELLNLLLDGMVNPAERSILETTVQIVLIVPKDATHEDVLARGLGTIARDGDRLLIVTHDHWGELLYAAGAVQLRDAWDRLLLEMGGKGFRSSVLYRDGGTMIVQAPAGLVPDDVGTGGATGFGNGERAGVGDTVQLVHQLPGAGHRLGVMWAVVESADATGWAPVLRLRIADDQSVFPGDSGGGVWKDGVLQANLWTTVMARKLYSSGAMSEGPTDLCAAAVRPRDVRSLVIPDERRKAESGGRLYLARLRQ